MSDVHRQKWAKENGLETPFSNAPYPCKCKTDCVDDLWYDCFRKPGSHCVKYRARAALAQPAQMEE